MTTETKPPPAQALTDLGLTPRERQITWLVCAGYTNAEIATRLGGTPTAISTYITHIYAKLPKLARARDRGWIWRKVLGVER